MRYRWVRATRYRASLRLSLRLPTTGRRVRRSRRGFLRARVVCRPFRQIRRPRYSPSCRRRALPHRLTAYRPLPLAIPSSHRTPEGRHWRPRASIPRPPRIARTGSIRTRCTCRRTSSQSLIRRCLWNLRSCSTRGNALRRVSIGRSCPSLGRLLRLPPRSPKPSRLQAKPMRWCRRLGLSHPRPAGTNPAGMIRAGNLSRHVENGEPWRRESHPAGCARNASRWPGQLICDRLTGSNRLCIMNGASSLDAASCQRISRRST